MATQTVHYRVSYDFTGFASPINNRDAEGNYVLNKAKPGSAIPIKFSLNGDRGLAIFESGYPKTETITCDPTAEVDGIEETTTPRNSALSYDATTDRYTYVWKTDTAWQGCRQLVLKLADGSAHRASFTFDR